MPTRTISGTLRKPNNDLWTSATITFDLENPYSSSVGAYANSQVSITTDPTTAAISATLSVPDTGTVRYKCTLPDSSYFYFYLGPGSGSVAFEDLLAGEFNAGTPAGDLPQHAARIASASQLGHFKVGSGLSIDGDGVLTASGGASAFVDLTDTPGSITADQPIFGNAGGTALEHKTASQARTLLSVVPGTDVQAYDAGLADIAGLAVTDGNFIVGDGANWVAENGATVRASLGLGTLATQSGSFTGGGTLATAGFTLTVPATGTAALLGTTQTFTGDKTFSGDLASPGAGSSSTKLGSGAAAAGNQSLALGVDSSAPQIQSIALGRGSLTTAMNQMAIGSNDCRIDDVYIGKGYQQGAPPDISMQPTRANGTNLAGADFSLGAGTGTGNGAGGSLLLQTSPAGASGSSQNSPVTAAEVDDQPPGGDETRLLLLDLSDGTLKRVKFGADGSGGAGLKVLAVDN